MDLFHGPWLYYDEGLVTSDYSFRNKYIMLIWCLEKNTFNELHHIAFYVGWKTIAIMQSNGYRFTMQSPDNCTTASLSIEYFIPIQDSEC